MAHDHRIVKPAKSDGVVLSQSGEQLTPPDDWAFLPAGDAAITRSVKTKGPAWVVQVRRGRRLISKGIWAKKEHILASQEEVELKRSTPEYARRLKKDRARREAKYKVYVKEFFSEVSRFLDFHPSYKNEEKLLAEKVTVQATPVGSGTVARTTRIPVARRAEAAVIAWMRHQTTAYDAMPIAREKGKRREVRRQLAEHSAQLLQAYRQGREVPEHCPLQNALR